MAKSAEEKKAEQDYQDFVVDPHPQWFSDPDAVSSDPVAAAQVEAPESQEEV